MPQRNRDTLAATPPFAPNGLVTLTSDFGWRDGYLGAMKGALLSVAAQLRLHDLAHDLAPQDVTHAARVLCSACPRFPAGTVHLAVVDPGVGGARAALVVAAGGHVFVGPDNGLFDPVANLLGAPRQARRIDAGGALAAFLAPAPSATFHGRDVFAPVAGALASGRVGLADIGPVHAAASLELPRADRRGEVLHGVVTHLDRFGNAITNLARSDLHGPLESLHVLLTDGEPLELVQTYEQAAPGATVALVGSDGLLEIAVRDGSAARRLGLAAGAAVRVAPRPDPHRS